MYTSYDAIEYLLSSTGGGAQDQEHRVLRQSVFHAYRDLVTTRSWLWHHASETIDLCATDKLSMHTLPWGVQSVDAFTLPHTGLVAEYLSPIEWERLMNSQFKSFVRVAWTVLPSKLIPDRYDLCVFNGWNGDTCVTVSYRRRPRDLRFTGWEPQARSGSISWTGTDVVGSGTSFTNLMIGSVLRVSIDPARHPEGLAGMNAYSDEGLIYGVANPGRMYVHTPAGRLVYPDGTKYIITDYLDISPGMYTAMLSGAEVWLSRLTGRNVEGAMGVYGRDLRMAFESDAVAPVSGRRQGTTGYQSFWYLRPGCDQGTNNPNPSSNCCDTVDGGSSGSTYEAAPCR
jgi:hypothetical protein